MANNRSNTAADRQKSAQWRLSQGRDEWYPWPSLLPPLPSQHKQPVNILMDDLLFVLHHHHHPLPPVLVYIVLMVPGGPDSSLTWWSLLISRLICISGRTGPGAGRADHIHSRDNCRVGMSKLYDRMSCQYLSHQPGPHHRQIAGGMVTILFIRDIKPTW